MNRVLAVLIVLLVAACATPVDKPAGLVPPAEPLFWPQPPEAPRIKFLYAFRGPDDLGFRASFFTRLWHLIVGEENREMIRPYAVAADGRVVAVADPGIRGLHLFDVGAGEYRRITRVGDETLVSPVGVAIGPERLYLSDSVLGKVFVLDRRGESLLTIGGFERPTGIAVDHGSGRIYVADTLAHRIVILDAGGKRLAAFGGRGTDAGQLNFPTHLFLREGRLYVNDAMNFRLQAFDLDGNYLFAFGTQGDGSGYFAQPKGVGVDGQGNVYVVDALFDRVQIFDPRGRFLLAFGGPGEQPGELWLPAGLSVARDLLYVADSYNRRVQVFQFLGGG